MSGLIGRLFHLSLLFLIRFTIKCSLGFDFFGYGQNQTQTRNTHCFQNAIAAQDSGLLAECISDAFENGIDTDYAETFLSIILETWHDEHEDIVDIVYDFKDNRFTKPLLIIASNPDIYRKYDYELEPTLRKCFHTLKAIDTPEAYAAVNELISSKNPNILYALENYEHKMP